MKKVTNPVLSTEGENPQIATVYMTVPIASQLHVLTSMGSIYTDSLLVLIEAVTAYAGFSEESLTQAEIQAMATVFDLRRVLKALTNVPRANPDWDMNVERFMLSVQDEVEQLSGE